MVWTSVLTTHGFIYRTPAHFSLAKGLATTPMIGETGASSLLWATLLSLLPLTEKPIFGVKAVGIAFHALNAALVTFVVLKLSQFVPNTSGKWRDPLIGVASGMLVALHPGLLQAATSGMEVSLTSALLLGMVSLLLSAGPTLVPSLLAGILATLAVLARPEAVMFCGPLGLFLALRQRDWSRLSVSVGGAAGIGAWILLIKPPGSSHASESRSAGRSS